MKLFLTKEEKEFLDTNMSYEKLEEYEQKHILSCNPVHPQYKASFLWGWYRRAYYETLRDMKELIDEFMEHMKDYVRDK